MGTILHSNELKAISDFKKQGKTIILLGGCFDILHAGHIEFLKRAKELGDILIVLLEPDEKIKKLKGKDRPVNTQNDRAAILANLPFVSFVINLEEMANDKNYEILVKQIEPDIIAVSGSDKVFEWEKKLEEKGSLRIVKVMARKANHSTTNLIDQLK